MSKRMRQPKRQYISYDYDEAVDEYDYSDAIQKEDIDIINKYVLSRTPYAQFQRGDTLVVWDTGYRNDGLYMWNGSKAIPLYTEYDMYGSVPPEIEIADGLPFTPYSWIRLVDHNEVVWFSQEIRARMKFTQESQPFTCDVVINNKKWTFEFSDYGDKYENITAETLEKEIMNNHCVFMTQDSEEKDSTIYFEITNTTHK